MKTTVYLAGKMTGLSLEEMQAWRVKAKNFLQAKNITVIDPTITDFGHEPEPKEIVRGNKYMIDRSDVIFAELNHREVSIGTVGEIVYAATKNKPVIAWSCKDGYAENPWVEEHITAIFYNDFNGALNYLVANFAL